MMEGPGRALLGDSGGPGRPQKRFSGSAPPAAKCPHGACRPVCSGQVVPGGVCPDHHRLARCYHPRGPPGRGRRTHGASGSHRLHGPSPGDSNPGQLVLESIPQPLTSTLEANSRTSGRFLPPSVMGASMMEEARVTQTKHRSIISCYESFQMFRKAEITM